LFLRQSIQEKAELYMHALFKADANGEENRPHKGKGYDVHRPVYGYFKYITCCNLEDNTDKKTKSHRDTKYFCSNIQVMARCRNSFA
jgi:hypothetical protein